MHIYKLSDSRTQHKSWRPSRVSIAAGCPILHPGSPLFILPLLHPISEIQNPYNFQQLYLWVGTLSPSTEDHAPTCLPWVPEHLALVHLHPSLPWSRDHQFQGIICPSHPMCPLKEPQSLCRTSSSKEVIRYLSNHPMDPYSNPSVIPKPDRPKHETGLRDAQKLL